MYLITPQSLLSSGRFSTSALLRQLILFCGLVSLPVFADWQAVTGASVEQGPRVYVRGKGYYSDAAVSISAQAANPLRLVVTASSYAVTNADGRDEANRPYFNLNSTNEPVRIDFAMQRGPFSYTAEVFEEVADGSDDPTVTGPVTFNDASVHDPSVVRTPEGEFYVFGSHLAVAKSDNLMDWELVATDVTDENPLFDTYATEAAEGIAWSGGHVGSWAADVIQLEDGRYYFYYNHCASPDTGLCDASRSYLGVAVSDNVEGPYENISLILRSGHVGDENPGANGENYNGNQDPNAIDPDVFFDKEGRLWMVYGSYSGGIWIMEMDPATGLALPDQGYGTKLMGGFYSAIEGPYMLYSPKSDYYYLFTSFGGYEQADGYNMRIARSRTPTGPFVDASGQDMIGASGGWASIEPYGVKLMGGHIFDVQPGEQGSDYGYMAPGHNSAWYDPQTGKHFVIFHTRFPEGGEGHAIRVHELFINADGWLVASPHRYVEQIEGENVVDSTDVVGTYRFLNHEKDINREAKRSTYLTLKADGTVVGQHSGTYDLGSDNEITLYLDGTGVFEGVLAWQWNENQGRLVPTFSALSDEGISVWGTQLPAMTTSQAMDAIINALSVPAQTTSNLVLPQTGAQGATITWISDHPAIISANGNVERPMPGEEDVTVTLRAVIELDGVQQEVSFTVTVKARKPFNRVAWYQFENNLNDTLGIQPEGTGTAATPQTPGGNVQYAAGAAGQALWLDGATGVRLPDGLIDNYTYTVSLWLNPELLTSFTTAFFGAQAQDNWISLVPKSWDDNTMLWRGSVNWYDATAGFAIDEAAWSHVAFTVDEGQIRLYINGEQVFSGTGFGDLFTAQEALFSLGVNYWDIPFQGLIDELAVYDDALTRGEIVALDIDRLSTADLLEQVADNLNLGNLNTVTEDLDLRKTGLFTSQINWSSSNPAVISADGEVVRPGADEADAQVTLTATIVIGNQQLTREFTATVLSQAPARPVAEFNFDNGDLVDAQNNFADGTVTGSRVNEEGGLLSFFAGVSGQALMLDGSTGVNLPDDLITDDTYSVSLWLNPQELTMYTTAFFGYASTDSWVSLVPRGHDGVSQQSMVWSGTAWYDAGMGTQISADTWSHVVMVVNNGQLRTYINGTETFRGTDFPDVFSSGATNGFALGVNFWDTPFEGLVDEVKVFDYPLTAADVVNMYSSVMP